MRPTLSVADVVALTGWHERRVRRAFVAWETRGWPLVTRQQGVRGDARGALRVDEAEFRAVLAGDLRADAIATAA